MNELLTNEWLGLCDIGHGGSLFESGRVTVVGVRVVNPLDGLLSRERSLVASEMLQCADSNWLLGGQCRRPQGDATHGVLQRNIGLGGTCVVAPDTRV